MYQICVPIFLANERLSHKLHDRVEVGRNISGGGRLQIFLLHLQNDFLFRLSLGLQMKHLAKQKQLFIYLKRRLKYCVPKAYEKCLLDIAYKNYRFSNLPSEKMPPLALSCHCPYLTSYFFGRFNLSLNFVCANGKKRLKFLHQFLVFSHYLCLPVN